MASRGLRFTTQDDPTVDTNSLTLKLSEELMTLSRPKKRTPHNRGKLVDVHYCQAHNRTKKRCPSQKKQSTSSTSVSSIVG